MVAQLTKACVNKSEFQVARLLRSSDDILTARVTLARFPPCSLSMRKPLLLLVAVVLLIGGLFAIKESQRPPPPQFAPSLTGEAAPDAAAAPTRANDPLPPFLPPEARQTIALIQRGGPYPHRQDGSVFGNREQRLPERPRGYYREFTVETPGAPNRGARRIVTGGNPPTGWFYTDGHYETFRSFDVPPAGSWQ
ncbi:ribonuclease domain-containing protein [Aeromonas taiwanensis]|uniref:ribonuclease domain-containing protein n=1 Tax=Aeromonas taiwanensis TaxID=633417 RepID=UPI00248ED7B6|nr:ribonuclease domain-containing protein [Aeromonas taiwanensis]